MYRTLEVQHEELRTASLQAGRQTEKGPGALIRLIPLTLNRSPTRHWHSARLSALVCCPGLLTNTVASGLRPDGLLRRMASVVSSSSWKHCRRAPRPRRAELFGVFRTVRRLWYKFFTPEDFMYHCAARQLRIMPVACPALLA